MPNQPQPVLPSPTRFTDLERAYRQDEPANLFPPNQDSNFGTYRKILCATLQDVADQIELLLNENFIATSTQFLSFHEEEAGLPALETEPVLYRQNRVAARVKKGLFSRTRRNTVIESFISATAGTPTSIGTGIPIGSGLTLFSGVSGNPKNFYKVIEDIPNFHYYVYMDVAVNADLVGLQAELQRVTPAGIGFTIYGWSNNKTGGGKAPAKAGASSHHP
jgi:hypothetical protein